MKKSSLFGLFAITCCLAACSDGNDVKADFSLDNSKSDFTPLYSDVPIRFAPVSFMEVTVEEDSIDGAMTRGSLDDGDFTTDDVGLFCLAKRILANDAPFITWSGTTAYPINTTYSLWKRNVRASVIGTSAGKGTLAWNAGDTQLFYPLNDYYAYGFVAYYPYTPYICYSSTNIRAYIVVDGRQDVRYAMAKKPRTTIGDDNIDKLGFSAAYYRSIDPEPGAEEWIYPYFVFQPLMSRLEFNFRLKTQPVVDVRVDKVEFDDFPNVVHLKIATRTGSGDNADMSDAQFDRLFVLNDDKLRSELKDSFPELTSAYGHFELCERNGEPIASQRNADGTYKYILTTTRQKVGDCIMIPPVYKSHSRSSLKLFITLRDNDGNTYRNAKAFVINAPDAGWETAKRYPINIALNSPIPMGARAELGGWDDSAEIEVEDDVKWVKTSAGE